MATNAPHTASRVGHDPSSPATTVSVADLLDCTVAFFRATGLSAEHSLWTAEALVEADRAGAHTHGVARLESYGAALQNGEISVEPEMLRLSESGAILRLDAGNAQGQVAGRWAVDEGMALASRLGVALIALRGANHLGSLGYYLERAANAGYAGWLTQATSPTTLAVGAREPRLGNNPFALAVPSGGQYPLVLDMSCSTVSRGRVRIALRDGAPIPAGWALAPDGTPATTAAQAMAGGLLPFAGHKGAGLSTLLGAFSGVLTGAAFGPHVDEKGGGDARDIGAMLILIDVGALLDPRDLRERMAEYINFILESPLVPGAAPVTIPGKGAWERRERNATEVTFSAEAAADLRRVFLAHGVQSPEFRNHSAQSTDTNPPMRGIKI